MNISSFVNNFQFWWLAPGVFVISFFPVVIFAKRFILNFITKIIQNKNIRYLPILEKHHFLHYLTRSLISLYLIIWDKILAHIFLEQHFVTQGNIVSLLIKAKNLGLSLFSTFFFSNLLISCLNVYFTISKQNKKKTLSLYINIGKIIVTILAILIILFQAFNVSLQYLFTSLGAATALLAFVCKDFVLSFIASIQISLQDIIQDGDMIKLDFCKLEGTVEEITITIVKVRNFDNTLSTVPTVAFVNNIVINYRTMFESHSRRIKRSINIDMKTIKYCSHKTKEEFKNIDLVRQAYKTNPNFVDLSLNITNLALLKIYILEYLKTLQEIHQEDFVFLVRQRDPTPQGLPVELYIFNKNTGFVEHENLQYNIFSHILNMLRVFELEVFQSLSSNKDTKKNN